MTQENYKAIRLDKVGLKAWLCLLVQTTLLITLKAALWVLGWVVVPLALLFRDKYPTSRRKGRVIDSNGVQHSYWMKFYSLPKWAWLWGNDEEGTASLMPYYWWQCEGKADTFWNQLYWLQIRNPVNNLRFTKLFQLDLIGSTNYTKLGKNYEFTVSLSPSGRKYYTFRYRRSWIYKGKRVDFIVHLGFKALIYTLNRRRFQKDLPAHIRYRGFGVQLIPAKGLSR